MDAGLEQLGKEKLTDPLLSDLCTPVSSCTLDKLCILWPYLLGGDAVFPGPRLDPLPLVAFGGGDIMRVGASRLVALRWPLERFLGMVGTGGASWALGTCPDGDESRKVRSVMEPELPFLSRAGRCPLPEP